MSASFLHVAPDKRAGVLNAALKEFARKGYDDASTNDIVKAAGISKGLLFHYFGTKKELFLFLFDYSVDLLKREYIDLVNVAETDIFARYRQAALLKVDLLHKYPCVLDFVGTATYTQAEPVKEAIAARRHALQALSMAKLFANVDTSRFAAGVDVARALNVIEWTMEGYQKEAQQTLQDVRLSQIDYDAFLADFDAYIALLKRSFYH